MTAGPEGRDLTRDELIELVDALARRPELWAHHVRHESDQRTYKQLLRDDHVAVWLICWTNDNDTDFHDHDVSAGAVAVVEGAIREERLVIGGSPVTRTLQAGDSLDFEASEIHRVAHAGADPAVTIHAYSPPLRRTGAYTVATDGQLQREAQPYDRELRAVAAAG